MSAKYKINLVDGALNYYLGAKNFTSGLNIFTKFKDKYSESSNASLQNKFGYLNPYQNVFNIGVSLSSPLLIRQQGQYMTNDGSWKKVRAIVAYPYRNDATNQGGNLENTQLVWSNDASAYITEAVSWANNGDTYVEPQGNQSKNVICAANSHANLSLTIISNDGHPDRSSSWGTYPLQNKTDNYLSLWLTQDRSDDGVLREYPYYNKPYLDSMPGDYINSVPYDVFACSDDVGIYYTSGANDNIFSDIYVVVTTDNSAINLPGYSKVGGLGAANNRVAILFTYSRELELQSPHRIIAHFSPSEISVPANTVGNLQGLVPPGWTYNSTSGFYIMSDDNELRNRMPWAAYTVPSDVRQSPNLLWDNSNTRIKALPLLIFFKNNESTPYALYQPFNATQMTNTSETVNAPGTIYDTKASGHTQVVPFFTNTDSHNVDWNSKLLTKTKQLVPDLINTNGDFSIINSIVDKFTFSQAIEDPDTNAGGSLDRYADANRKLGLKAKGVYAYYNWLKDVNYFAANPSISNTSSDIATTNVVVNSNVVNLSITPTSSTQFTFGQTNTYLIPQGSNPVTDLFGSLGLVDGVVRLSNFGRLCVFRSDKDVMVSDHLFKPRTPAGGVDISLSITRPDGSPLQSGETFGKIVDGKPYMEYLILAYPKVVAPDYTWWPAACNFDVYKYDSTGNRNTIASYQWDGYNLTNNNPEQNPGDSVTPNPPSVDNPSGEMSASSVLYVKI